MAIQKKSLKGAAKAKPKRAETSSADRGGKTDSSAQLVLAKKLALAKLATARLSTARMVTTRKIGG
jgi:hypothetical protein